MSIKYDPKPLLYGDKTPLTFNGVVTLLPGENPFTEEQITFLKAHPDYQWLVDLGVLTVIEKQKKAGKTSEV